MNSQEILEHIDNEISRLQQVKALLQGTSGRSAGKPGRTRANAAPATAVKVKRVLSPEARKKIAAAQRKRWANARKAQAKQ